MGIPFYFSTLTKKYDNIISTTIPENIDLYCLDFNGVIHPVCKKMLETESFSEDELISKLYEKINDDIAKFQPKKTLVCVDGVAPVAKMIQQRKRRYLSVYRNTIDNVQSKWDTNAITPGTTFMKKLNTFLKKQKNITYNGSDKEGEGEHKIFTYVKDNQITVINGLDADLIILSLLSNKKQIHLMREDTNIIYVSIENLRKAILQELTEKWNLEKSEDIYSESSNEIIASYCVMCSLMGNDFIPHLLTLTFKSNGLEKLVYHTGNAIKNNGMLVIEDKINYETLKEIIQKVGENEDTDIFKETEKYIRNTANMETSASELYGIKNKEKFAYEIYADINKWRITYYKNLFYSNIINDSSVIQNACHNYIYGIYWTYSYYKKQYYDNTWYYPYQYPPSIRDISNYMIGNNEPVLKKNIVNIDSNFQLLVVLPKQSKALISKQYVKFMEDESKGMIHYYPIKYAIRTYLKTHLWECEPILPTINVTYISNHIK